MKNLPHPAIPRPRFQFTLGNLYLVLALILAAQMTFVPMVAHDDRFLALPRIVPVALFSIVTVLGAFLGLWRAHARRLEGSTNNGSILWYVLVVWTAFVFALCADIGVTLVCIAVTLGLACLGMWIGHRQRKDHDASLLVAALTVVLGWIALAVCLSVLTGLFLRHHGCGSYESYAISMCKTYGEAQEIYHRTDWDGDNVLEYAASFTGDNSLYEKTSGTGDLGLVSSVFANAEGDPGTAEATGDYVFKVLTAQGPHATGGALSYLDGDGNLVNGYALIACPARYDKQRCYHTFIYSHQGKVYQCDLGEGTHVFYLNTCVFDPGPNWEVAE